MADAEENELSAFDLPGAERAPLDIREVSLDEIAELENIRPAYHDIEGLAETMYLEGQLQPCRVRPAPKGASHGKPFELIYGYRRKRAAEFLREQGKEGWDKLRVEVLSVDGSKLITQTIVENFQRDQLSPVAEAQAMLALKRSTDPEMTNAEVARQLGCDPALVSKRLSLLALALPSASFEPVDPDSADQEADEIDHSEQPTTPVKKRVDILEMVDSGEISASTAEEITKLDKREEQEKLAELVVRNGWNVKRAKKWVDDVKEHKIDEAADDDRLGPIEMIKIEDVTPLTGLIPRPDLTEEDHERLTCYALLRNGMDAEILDWIEDDQGFTYEQLWDYLRGVPAGKLKELRERLILRFISASHRYHSLEPSLVDEISASEEWTLPSGESSIGLPSGDDDDDHILDEEEL